MQIALVERDEEIEACFPVMQQLRPHLVQAEFVQRVQRQAQHGYQLVSLSITDGSITDRVVAVAGFRLSECLAWGKVVYVDDLVTQDCDRSAGYGTALLKWLMEYAKSQGCEQLHLDSAVQRFAAHRFYLRQRLNITSHHFAIKF